jgi:hypothetical protein
MTKVRSKETTMDSFFGNFLYEQVVPKNHFLVKLKGMIDWQRYTKKFLVYYKGKGEIGQALVLADHIGNTGLRILASSFSIYSIGVR